MRAHARRPAVPRIRPAARLAAAGIVAIAAVAVLIWAGSATAAPAQVSPIPATAGEGRTVGSAGAPVTIEEWADFQCPACGQFARTTQRELLATYVASGRVRYSYRNFAFLGSESGWAAEAAQCAADGGRFWEYHDLLYASQAGEQRGTFARPRLKALGQTLGLGAPFATCVDSGRYAEAVRDETARGQALGVRATPTLFVNGRRIQGAVSMEQLRAIIDPLIAGR
jgi:protein-disulfide isomerase